MCVYNYIYFIWLCDTTASVTTASTTTACTTTASATLERVPQARVSTIASATIPRVDHFREYHNREYHYSVYRVGLPRLLFDSYVFLCFFLYFIWYLFINIYYYIPVIPMFDYFHGQKNRTFQNAYESDTDWKRSMSFIQLNYKFEHFLIFNLNSQFTDWVNRIFHCFSEFHHNSWQIIYQGKNTTHQLSVDRPKTQPQKKNELKN